MSHAPRFISKQEFLPQSDVYSLLPLRFDRREDGSCFVVNEAGEYVILAADEFSDIVNHRLATGSDLFRRLRAKHFVSDGASSALLDVLAAKYRTKKSFLDGFAKLHIFVTTLRCNQSCPYCQVSRHDETTVGSTMTEDVIRRSVDLMLATPSPTVTVELQGGESLLAFDVVRELVRYSRERNERVGKHIEYVICTNLVGLTDDHLSFFKDHGVQISTSLDGPAYLHDLNRPLRGGPSHATVVRNIQRAQEALGPAAVSCLMTATRESLKYPREIVDEYLRFDLRSVFIRELNPYGFAAKAGRSLNYPARSFLQFFREALAHIIEVNRSGRTFSEAFTTLLLSKLLTPWPAGFVDLQSPSGAGFGTVVYNYDGDVYASDESRMLSEMGEPVFRLGNVLEDRYEEIFFGSTMQMLASASCNESLAGCADCAYQAYCGADPVRNFRVQGDIQGNRPGSGFCEKNKGVIKHVVDLIESADQDLERIFWAWIQREDVDRMRLVAPEWECG